VTGDSMKIGVIGIGEMGGTLARRWRQKGHRVRVANSRGPEAADIYGPWKARTSCCCPFRFPPWRSCLAICSTAPPNRSLNPL